MIDDGQINQGKFLKHIHVAIDQSNLSRLTVARLMSGLSAFAWEEYVSEKTGVIDS